MIHLEGACSHFILYLCVTFNIRKVITTSIYTYIKQRNDNIDVKLVRVILVEWSKWKGTFWKANNISTHFGVMHQKSIKLALTILDIMRSSHTKYWSPMRITAVKIQLSMYAYLGKSYTFSYLYYSFKASAIHLSVILAWVLNQLMGWDVVINKTLVMLSWRRSIRGHNGVFLYNFKILTLICSIGINFNLRRCKKWI